MRVAISPKCFGSFFLVFFSLYFCGFCPVFVRFLSGFVFFFFMYGW